MKFLTGSIVFGALAILFCACASNTSSDTDLPQVSPVPITEAPVQEEKSEVVEGQPTDTTPWIELPEEPGKLIELSRGSGFTLTVNGAESLRVELAAVDVSNAYFRGGQDLVIIQKGGELEITNDRVSIAFGQLVLLDSVEQKAWFYFYSEPHVYAEPTVIPQTS